jgi:hypothetical protein
MDKITIILKSILFQKTNNYLRIIFNINLV